MPEKPSYASISNPSTYTKKSDGKLPLKLKLVIYVHGEPTEDFVEVYSRAVSFITIKEKGMNNQYQCRIQCWTPWFNPKEETSIALAWISFSSLSTQMFAREALFSLASAVGTPLQVDKGHKEEECRLPMEVEGGLIYETKINGAKFEGDLQSILDEKKKVLSLQQTGKEVTLPTSSNFEKNNVERVDEPGPLLVAATSRNKEDTKTTLPRTLTSKISEQLGTTTTKQLSSRFMKDRELDSPNAVVVTKSRQYEAKKFDVLRDEKFGQYEGLHVTNELSAESGNTLDLDKQIEQTGKLKQCCHDEHTTQQALVTHEKEFIVTEKIDSKEINPNTPTMFILDQEVATNNLNESKEK
ncbi:hypothetical protein MTR67_044390 [Solanum verrucosum]|uniref:DUF4283 domain-containing protein n=1 Tax=Solanum verrucosum TaxID=315347 RepID=A0AAF0ZVL3_SOLVR|nr:hypothetical protein MTR67_044390 [Solanum verrucosum]